eukprot:COSAG06_NODE_422_length_15966_cov_34.618832_10_plen_102_part_00
MVVLFGKCKRVTVFFVKVGDHPDRLNRKRRADTRRQRLIRRVERVVGVQALLKLGTALLRLEGGVRIEREGLERAEEEALPCMQQTTKKDKENKPTRFMNK